MSTAYILVLFLPLIGFVLSGVAGGLFGYRSSVHASVLLNLLSAGLAWLIFLIDWGQPAQIIAIFDWIMVGDLQLTWSVRADALTRVMLVVVMSVSALVQIYSYGYMHDDPAREKFFSYLSLFTFMMLALVTAADMAQLFFGWEGVGLASYLLIGFWYQKESACQAAVKAFVVNRVADAFLIMGLALLYIYAGSLNFDIILSEQGLQSLQQPMAVFGLQARVLDWACFLMFLGAMGKSAQFIFHVWLPDAMEGPTPVSALIHAATMVTAGVFLLSRCSILYADASPYVNNFIILIGGITAFFAASVALFQQDIKKIIAYSTCSQLGYMFIATGVGAYQAAMFHLFTHAFFKAMLFLGAGNVIHGAHHEQDIGRMGNIARYMPLTMFLMWIGTLAITGVGIPGVFGFAGFYSKDMIIESAFASPLSMAGFAFFVTCLVALMTAIYSWRLIIYVFHKHQFSNIKESHEGHYPHEAPAVMWVPVAILSVGAIFSGILFYSDFVGYTVSDFWAGALHELQLDGQPLLEAAHHVPLYIKLLPLVMSIMGALMAFMMYYRGPAQQDSVTGTSYLRQFLVNKWYIDELYQCIFVRSYQKIADFCAWILDKCLIDGYLPGGGQRFSLKMATALRRFHSGSISHYALVIFVAFILTTFL